MVTHYIYHIPGIKIGCTKNLTKRMQEQGFTEWEILETHTDGWLAGDREIELQKEYGLPVDTCHYMITCQNSAFGSIEIAKLGGDASRGVSKPNHPGPSKESQSKGGKGHRYLTYEVAQEIRAKYVPRKYTVKMLAKDYNVKPRVIAKIVHNITYLEP